jgi:ribosomal protein L40E
MNIVCDSCGARLVDGSTMCDLCGTSVGESTEAVLEQVDSQDDTSIPVEDIKTDTVFCNQCGWQNPGDSNFCSRCGSAIQKVGSQGSQDSQGSLGSSGAQRLGVLNRPPVTQGKSKAEGKSAASGNDSNAAVGKQIGIIVMSALLVVLALYMVTTMSKSGSLASEATLQLSPGQEEPLAAQFVGTQSILLEKMNGLSGDSLIAVKRELVDLYFAAARFDLAAAETEAIAGMLQSENEWTVAGNLYYDWMERKDPSQRTPWAQKAIAAYREALEINPLNLDVRTDMAIAYMYDPPNAMMAIQETNAVLEQDSLHMQANFNRGIMLMQIDRTDQAVEQFEKVMRLIGNTNDPVYVRANELVERLRSGN